MLQLSNISLFQFKNYTNRLFEFKKRVTGITGKNGAGKTNLLDAIHYLCFTKSYFGRDNTNVQNGKNGFRIEGNFILRDKPEKAVCILRENGKKEFYINESSYEKFSRHIGHYPCVIIAPDDAELITGDSRERRLFLDSLLCQVDQQYMQNLITYKKVLEQRNSLLRGFAESVNRDLSLLDVLDEQLSGPGACIFNKRKEFLVAFLPQVANCYREIARQTENIQLFYDSDLLQSSFGELLKVTRQKDLFAQRTTAGIHRDDLDILLDNQVFRLVASQGQRKSLLFALKLAELDVLRKEKNFAPLLLLDDVFEKLDEDRINNLLQRVCIDNDGQVFITDTNYERLEDKLANLPVEFEMINL